MPSLVVPDKSVAPNSRPKRFVYEYHLNNPIMILPTRKESVTGLVADLGRVSIVKYYFRNKQLDELEHLKITIQKMNIKVRLGCYSNMNIHVSWLHEPLCGNSFCSILCVIVSLLTIVYLF